MKISAVIITFNEEINIERCIDSVSEVADEIIIIDSYSKDRTKEICLKKGVTFIEHVFEGFIQKKNFGLTKATHDFVLSLDADEFLSAELQQSILSIKNNPKAQAYTMNRLSSLGGKWIRSTDWYPDRKLRLWNKNIGKWGGYNPHDKVIINQGISISHLKGDLKHVAYRDTTQLLEKLVSYSDIYARTHAFQKRVSAFKIFYKTTYSFFSNYILKGGIWDGYEGLIVSASTANGVLYKYAKLLELNRSLKVSLIITTYNRKDALELVLLSILNQVSLPEEVIVADDGSTSDTLELIEFYQDKFPVPLKHCWQEDKGFQLARIRNKAIAMSSYSYIIMIDGDIVVSKYFVQDHKKFAWKKRFIQASRVLLNERQTQSTIETKENTINFWHRGLKNRKNAIRSSLLASLFSYFNNNIYRVRGANLSFWRDDAIRINGFNEDFLGWGREDSEFVVRMKNAGIRKFHLKFAGLGYHLYHQESSRELLPQNQTILDNAIQDQSTWCKNGLDKYLSNL